MTEQSGTVAGLYSYPVKGFSAHVFERADLAAGETMPFDRAYAIENGPGRFKPDAPGHVPKINFLMRMREERIASLETLFDPETRVLTILRDGKQVARGDLSTPLGCNMIEQFIGAYFERELRGRPKIHHVDGHSFSDVPSKCLHVINLASVRALAERAGKELDPERFRANVVIDGLEPWEELGWVDKEITLGSARGRVWGRTDRCAAVNVNPETAARDAALPALLEREFGHIDFGVYVSIVDSGIVSKGDKIALA